MARLTIRLLHTESCSPENAVAARQALDAALAEVGLSGHPVEDVCIETEEQAVAYDFVGGPAVMVNGVDVDPTCAACARAASDAGPTSPLRASPALRRWR